MTTTDEPNPDALTEGATRLVRYAEQHQHTAGHTQLHIVHWLLVFRQRKNDG